jgi:hypothetical protein
MDDDMDEDEVHPSKGIPEPQTNPGMAPEMRRMAIADAIKNVPDVKDTSEEARNTFIASLPSRVQLLLTQPFGKSLGPSNPVPTFLGQSELRHILIPLLKSGFIDSEPRADKTPSDLASFLAASPFCRQAQQLLTDYGHIDFRPLRTLWDDDSW